MIYLISQDWRNTCNNHAGIKYLCNKLEEGYSADFVSIVFPDFFSSSSLRIINSVMFRLARMRHKLYIRRVYKQLSSQLKSGDKIVLMEYMDKSYPMIEFAESLKLNFPFIPIYSMVHLVPEKIKDYFPTQQEFNRWISPIDIVLTLGHSLTDYLMERGVSSKKIVTTFHYVDSYYYNSFPVRKHEKLCVIAMGNQMRNIKLLHKIVSTNNQVNFIICQGVMDLSFLFKGLDNVCLIPYVDEEVLRKYMENADISLNVMKDTIGSNVIVTSLAMGLAMVCSDVGSIKDYCDKTNTIFCDNESLDDFSNAISFLQNNPDILSQMQLSAAAKSREFTIDKFASLLKSL